MWSKFLHKMSRIIQNMRPMDWKHISEQDLSHIKENFLYHARLQGGNGDNWVIDLGFCKYYFNAESWERARNAGNDFEQMLKNTQEKTFLTLTAIGQEVDAVHISSLWRPWGGTTHPAGFGIDIGILGNYWMYRDNLKPDPPELKKIRNNIWNTGLILQWIGPYKMRGSNISSKWVDNKARYQEDKMASALDAAHVNHVHITVKE